MNWRWIIIIPRTVRIVRKSTLIDATKLPPLFEDVSSSARQDTFCGKLVERGFQNRELSDGEEGLKELEGKTIKWHSMQGRERGGPTEVSGCKLLSEFMTHSAFRPNYVQDRGDLWNRRFAQLSKKTCCRSRKLNSSQNFLFYILFTLQVIWWFF